jgi:hypothetical protein
VETDQWHAALEEDEDGRNPDGVPSGDPDGTERGSNRERVEPEWEYEGQQPHHIAMNRIRFGGDSIRWRIGVDVNREPIPAGAAGAGGANGP